MNDGRPGAVTISRSDAVPQSVSFMQGWVIRRPSRRRLCGLTPCVTSLLSGCNLYSPLGSTEIKYYIMKSKAAIIRASGSTTNFNAELEQLRVSISHIEGKLDKKR